MTRLFRHIRCRHEFDLDAERRRQQLQPVTARFDSKIDFTHWDVKCPGCGERMQIPVLRSEVGVPA